MRSVISGVRSSLLVDIPESVSRRRPASCSSANRVAIDG
jgi:hypothetical protein